MSRTARFTLTIPAPTPQTRPGAKKGVRGSKKNLTPPIAPNMPSVNRKSKLHPTARN
jgi:hypothetical protein